MDVNSLNQNGLYGASFLGTGFSPVHIGSTRMEMQAMKGIPFLLSTCILPRREMHIQAEEEAITFGPPDSARATTIQEAREGM